MNPKTTPVMGQNGLDTSTPKTEPKRKRLFAGFMEDKTMKKTIDETLEGLIFKGKKDEFIELYKILSKNDREYAFKRAVDEFVARTQPYEHTLTEGNVKVAIRLCNVFQHIAENSKTLYKDDEGVEFTKSERKLGEQIKLILKNDGTSEHSVLYHQHPSLILESAKIIWEVNRHDNLKEMEEVVADWLRTPELKVWALEIALASGYKETIRECVYNVTFTAQLLASEFGRSMINEEMEKPAENGNKENIINNLANVEKCEIVLPLLEKWAADSRKYIYAIKVVGLSPHITLEDRQKLVSIVLSNNDVPQVLELMLHLPRTQKMAIGMVLGKDNEYAILTDAMTDAVDEERFIANLASFGEEKTGKLLRKWLEDRVKKTEVNDEAKEQERQEEDDDERMVFYAFRVINALGDVSDSLHKEVVSIVMNKELDEEVRNAANELSRQLTQKETQRRIEIAQTILNRVFAGVIAIIKNNPHMDGKIESEVRAGTPSLTEEVKITITIDKK